ncbi:PKD domain-containing protein [Alteromonas ponticola]|uniref:PKD domain-containing protein n=1 Tax=Alteromonas ponticola TaxID=2720613 RepID=A0ABX1R459_9ALTE|nr:PKD domain-containing protein [Alteromonas ponticola]NMH59887.1 hypothetical protein [Alteromonas ponticola]
MSAYRFAIIFLVLFITACGGGGGSSSSPTPAPAPTPIPDPDPAPQPDPVPQVFSGIFLDSPVAGLGFTTTSGQQGVTNIDGEYAYEENDSVTFKIGDITLPDVTAAKVVTPLDVMGTKNTRLASVINLIRLIQSLDEDGDSSNGIVLSESLLTRLNASGLNFDDLVKSVSEFEQAVNNAGIFDSESGTTFISISEAIKHFEESLNSSSVLDSDKDGIPNAEDVDDDNDGVPDSDDMFPWDEAETLDFDLDGIGDNADSDDDNDGVEDNVDAEKRLILSIAGTLGTQIDYFFDQLNQRLVLISEDEKTLTVLDVNTGETLQTVSFNNFPKKIRLSSDSQKLYVATNSAPSARSRWDEGSSSIFTYDMESLEQLSKIDLDTLIYDFVVTANNRLITSSPHYYDGSRVWNFATAEFISELYGPERMNLSYDESRQQVYAMSEWAGVIYTVDTSSAGEWSLEGRYTNYSWGGRKFWNNSNDQELLTSSGLIINKDSFVATDSLSIGYEIEAAHFDASNNTMLLQFEDDTVFLYNSEYLAEISELALIGTVRAFNTTQHYLYYLSETGTGTKLIKSPKPCPACGENTAPVAAFDYTSASGTTADIFVFDGSSSRDAESALQYRWDLDGDGEWDTEFSSLSTIEKDYFASGTYLVTLQIKDAAGATHSKSKDVVVENGTKAAIEVSNPTANSYNFEALQSVFASTHGKLYVTDDENQLWIIDADTGLPESYFDFPFALENLTLSGDQNYIYLSLIDYASSYADRRYFIAAFDVSQQALVNVLEVDERVSHLDGLDDKIFAIFGNTLKQFDVGTGEEVFSTSINYVDGLMLNAENEELWLLDYQTIYRYQITVSGLSLISSPFIANVPFSRDAWLTPDGNHLISYDGSVIRVSDFTKIATLEGDLSYISSLTFDPDEKVLFAADNRRQLYYYSTESWQQIGSLTTQEDVFHSYVQGGEIKVFTSDYYESALESYSHPCSECGENTAPLAVLNYQTDLNNDLTTSVFSFDASSSSDAESSAPLVYRWDIDNDGEWDSLFSYSGTLEYRFVIPDTYTVAVQVKDEYGLVSTDTVTIEVSQGINDGTVVSNAEAYNLDFSPISVLTDTQRRKTYMTTKIVIDGSDHHRVYVVDIATGLAERYYQMPSIVEHMTLSQAGNTLYVTMPSRSHSSSWYEEDQFGYVAVFDLSTNVNPSHTHSLYVTTDPYDVVELNGELIISSGSGSYTDITLVDASDGSTISTYSSIYQQSNLALHPITNHIFVSETRVWADDIYEFSTDGSTFTYEKQHYLNAGTGGNVWLTPDGNFLISARGDVFSAVDSSFVMTLSHDSSVDDVAFDVVNNVVYTVNADRVSEYSLTDFVLVNSEEFAGGDKLIFTHDDGLMKLDSDTGVIERIVFSGP